MHESILDIQNSIWKIYKDFCKTGNVKEWEQGAKKISEKYLKDPFMLKFCENLLITWVPVIVKIKSTWRDQ